MTPRDVHKRFEDGDVTCAQYMLRRGLERAHRLLQTGGMDRPISAIAYDVGFGDLSHFNRTFRREFQMTPSELRKRRGETDSPATPHIGGTRGHLL